MTISTIQCYVVELRNGSGELIAILENAYNISYSQTINSPHLLTFNLPADDSKASNITLDNELWLRNICTDVVVRKFKLHKKTEART